VEHRREKIGVRGRLKFEKGRTQQALLMTYIK
jgi:hypothetical protein